MRTEEHPLDEVKIMIQDAVRAHPTDPTLQTILGRVTQLHRDFDVLPKTEVKKLRSLGEPSFEYGIYLGPSTIEEDHVIIGFHGVRMEVSLSEELDVRRDDLEQGQLLVLNGEQNIFEVLKEHYQPGEVAEVVNVIKPAGAAEVLEVLDEQETPQLRVQWREVEKQLVTIGTDLDAMRTYVKRGTIVQLDEQGEIATGLVRPTIHVRAGGSEGAILEISDALMRDGVQVGNLVRYDSSLKFAFEKVVSSATSKLTLEKVPDVTYEDIGGLEQVVGKIRDAIELPYIHRAEYREYDLTRPKGILLSGPPGCGKTLIAKAVANSLTTTIRDHLSELERRLVLYIHLHAHPDDAAQLQRYRELVGPAAANVTGPAAVAQLREWLGQFEIDLSRAQDELARTRAKLASADSVRAYFTNIKGPELLSKWVGETERQIRELFDEARRAATYDTPVVIFFDEMEALFRTRGAGRSSDVETTIVPQFLAEIDGVETAENVILIGASNRLDMIDPAFLRPGRFDYKFEIPRPNDTAAREIMSLSLLPTLPLSEAGLTPPTPGTQQLVFRTAYRALAADSPLRMIADLGADVRLIQSLMNESDYTQLNQMGPTTTVAQGRQRPISEELRSRLLLLRSSTPVQQIVDVLARLSAVYRTDPEAARTLNNYARAERIAEAIIVQAIDVLYADTSILSMFLVEKPHVARLREFVSGATIDSIVTRAKSYAMKRKIAEQSPDITLADVMAAISEEFDENKAQLAQYFVEHTLKRPAESIQAVEVTLQGVHDSPWLEYKQRPYRTPVRR